MIAGMRKGDMVNHFKYEHKGRCSFMGDLGFKLFYEKDLIATVRG